MLALHHLLQTESQSACVGDQPFAARADPQVFNVADALQCVFRPGVGRRSQRVAIPIRPRGVAPPDHHGKAGQFTLMATKRRAGRVAQQGRGDLVFQQPQRVLIVFAVQHFAECEFATAEGRQRLQDGQQTRGLRLGSDHLHAKLVGDLAQFHVRVDRGLCTALPLVDQQNATTGHHHDDQCGQKLFAA